MLYMVEAEIDTLCPQVSEETALEGIGAFNHISSASNAVDAFCGAPLYIRDVINEMIPLDFTLTGKLLFRPVIDWISTTVTLYQFGQNTNLGTVDLSDFTLDHTTGVIQNLNQTVIPITGAGAGSSGGESNCWTGGGMSGGGGGSAVPMGRDSFPYYIIASYKAGRFTEKTVDPSGLVNGATDVIVGPDAVGLRIGAEFYFDTDPTYQPRIDKRFITAINGNQVSFTPALGYGYTSSALFRQIDRQVRSACADIISDMVIYPPNTRMFWDELGKGNLINRWVRLSDGPISVSAAMKLAPYCQ